MIGRRKKKFKQRNREENAMKAKLETRKKKRNFTYAEDKPNEGSSELPGRRKGGRKG